MATARPDLSFREFLAGMHLFQLERTERHVSEAKVMSDHQEDALQEALDQVEKMRDE